MKHLLGITLTILSVTLCSYRSTAQDLIIEDALRFSALLKAHPDSLSPETLQKEYLNKGTKGIKIFTPRRIKNAENLAKWIYQRKAWYEKAAELAVPAVQNMQKEAAETLNQVKELLKQETGAPIYLLFGAGNSGGTASSRGLVVGLEVITRFVETEEEARETIQYFIAHEVVHVYQFRNNSRAGRSLLGQSLREGFCDFMATLVLEGIPKTEVDRHEYGLAHEEELWEEFKEAMHNKILQPWMFGKGKDGRPSDLGYWIGKQICTAYYEKAVDKEAALQELLKLKDIDKILEESGYGSF